MTMRYKTSAYRDDAARYRKKAEAAPQDGISVEDWRWVCLEYAKAYDSLADRHERAIDAGREAELAFWADVRGSGHAGGGESASGD